MTTCADFLAHGVESMPNPNRNIHCFICNADPSETVDLVRLPCHPNHVFDRACVVKWLRQWGVNTCPACRTALFELPEEEQENDEDDLIEDEEEEEEEANEEPERVSAHVQRLDADMIRLLNQGDEMSEYDPDEEASGDDVSSVQGSDDQMDDDLDVDSEEDPDTMDSSTDDSDSDEDEEMIDFIEEDSDDDDSENCAGDGGYCSEDSDEEDD